jgi:hypothetical protein
LISCNRNIFVLSTVHLAARRYRDCQCCSFRLNSLCSNERRYDLEQ